MKKLGILAIILATLSACEKNTEVESSANEIQEANLILDSTNAQELEQTDPENPYPVPAINFEGDWKVKSISDDSNKNWIPLTYLGLDFFPNSYFTKSQTLEIDVDNASVELTSVISTGDKFSLGKLDFTQLSDQVISLSTDNFEFIYRAWSSGVNLFLIPIDKEGNVIGKQYWFTKQ